MPQQGYDLLRSVENYQFLWLIRLLNPGTHTHPQASVTSTTHIMCTAYTHEDEYNVADLHRTRTETNKHLTCECTVEKRMQFLRLAPRRCQHTHQFSHHPCYVTHTQAHTHTNAHAHAHTHTRTRTHTHAHPCTYTYTHVFDVLFVRRHAHNTTRTRTQHLHTHMQERTHTSPHVSCIWTDCTGNTRKRDCMLIKQRRRPSGP